MALYHFSVTQIKRSEGSSAVASAAYRAGERLHSDRYDEVNDYTRKGGVIYKEIILAPQAPKEYADRETLWNAVEAAEKRNDAQLAYSFDFALQNEFTIGENMELARKFILENFVARGMTVDYAVHDPDRGEGGIRNPHVHVMAPIRPINPDGTWGSKQKKVEIKGENGDPIWDEKYHRNKFTAVQTTDWGTPETLEEWRKNWCEIVNAKFAEKGMPERIDWRSYERQGIDQLAQIHEGPSVRSMEKKGIPTEKGEYNRWIRAMNALLKEVRQKLQMLTEWIRNAEAELDSPQETSLRQILLQYMDMQRAGAANFSRYARQKASITTLKSVASAVSYLGENNIDTLEQLEEKLTDLTERYDRLSDSMKTKTVRMTVLREALNQMDVYKEYLPVYQEMSKPRYRFRKALASYKGEHESELKLFYRARRVLKEAGMPEQVDPKICKDWTSELAELEQEYRKEYAQLRPVREEQRQVSQIRYCVERVLRSEMQTEKEPKEEQLKLKKDQKEK